MTINDDTFPDYHHSAVNEVLLISLSLSILIISSCVSCVDQLSLKMEPNLEDFDSYLSNFVGDSQRLVLLLDYDGTLAPIAPHPNLTDMCDATKISLGNIAKNPKIFSAAISGRGVDNVKEKVDIDGMIFAGNHGLEILYPNGTRYNHDVGGVDRNYSRMVQELEKITRDGSWIENKGVSLTFHYRAMPEDQHVIIRDEAKEIIESHGYRANQAHCAIEAKPPVLWNKGKAAEYILNHEFGENWRNEMKVIFAGDDTTDEDVCELLRDVGVSFRVTKDPNIETKATYKIPSTDSVTTLLQWIEKRFK